MSMWWVSTRLLKVFITIEVRVNGSVNEDPVILGFLGTGIMVDVSWMFHVLR